MQRQLQKESENTPARPMLRRDRPDHADFKESRAIAQWRARLDPVENRLKLANENLEEIESLREGYAEDDGTDWENQLDMAQKEVQSANDDYLSILHGPHLTAEDCAKLAREDFAEDQAVRLAQWEFDRLVGPYPEETHVELQRLTSKGSKNTRRRHRDELSAYERRHRREISARRAEQDLAVAARKAERKRQRDEIEETKRQKRIRDQERAQAKWERYLPKLQAKQEAQMPELRAKYIAEYPKRYQKPVESLSHRDLMVALYYTDSNRGKESETESESSWDDDEPNSEDEVEETLDQIKALDPTALAFVPAAS